MQMGRRESASIDPSGVALWWRRSGGGGGLGDLLPRLPHISSVGYVTISSLYGRDSHITTFEDMLSPSPPPPAARARRVGFVGGPLLADYFEP